MAMRLVEKLVWRKLMERQHQLAILEDRKRDGEEVNEMELELLRDEVDMAKEELEETE